MNFFGLMVFLSSALLMGEPPARETPAQETPVQELRNEKKQSDEPRLLDNAALKKAFVGKTHIGFYRDYLERYGSVKFVEQYFEGGPILYKGGDITATGLWEITDNHICFDYDNDDFLPGCFVVVEKQGCYYSYESSPAAKGFVKGKKDWWIFSYVQGTKVDCEESELVS